MTTQKAELRLDNFKDALLAAGKKKNTVIMYAQSVKKFFYYVAKEGKRLLDDKLLLGFAKSIDSLSAKTINLYITGLNRFLNYIKYKGMRLKHINIQKNDYVANPLIESEYDKIIEAADSLGGDICAIIKTLAGTGIRVSELKFITVKAVNNGSVEIKNKGKSRFIPIGKHVSNFLLKYCADNNYTNGVIFRGKDGKSTISAGAVWNKIKQLSSIANVEKKKLFPHNFRHYYASNFIKLGMDVEVLRRILGHRSLKTTLIYLHPDGNYVQSCADKIVV